MPACDETACEAVADIDFGVAQNVKDWTAIYDLYDRDLAQRLGCSVNELAGQRSALVTIDPASIACGEHWPVEATGQDNHASQTNRRVDILFFDTDEVPTGLPGAPPGTPIYGESIYKSEYIPVAPGGDPSASIDYELWLELRDHWFMNPVPSASYSIRGPLPERTYERSGTLDEGGRLREQELPPGVYLVVVGESFTIAGSRYAAIAYADDRPDVYWLRAYNKAEKAGQMEMYEDQWDPSGAGRFRAAGCWAECRSSRWLHPCCLRDRDPQQAHRSWQGPSAFRLDPSRRGRYTSCASRVCRRCNR